MATIVQINRVNTNRTGAVSDVFTALHSDTALAGGNISVTHLPLAENAFTVSSGLITPRITNLSDVRVFNTPALRNSANNITWHVGDVAIVSASGDTGGPELVTNAQVSGFITNGVTITNGYDSEGNSRLGAENDTLSFGSTNAMPSASGGDANNGVEYTIQSISPDTTTPTTARVVFVSNTGIGNQFFVFLPGATETVNSGTYIYNGANQSDSDTDRTTENNEWVLIQPPGGTQVNIPTLESAVTPNITSTTPTTGVTRNVGNTAITAVSASIFTQASNSTALAAFPTGAFYMYANGMKIAANEITINTARTLATFSTPIVFPQEGATQTITFEITYLT